MRKLATQGKFPLLSRELVGKRTPPPAPLPRVCSLWVCRPRRPWAPTLIRPQSRKVTEPDPPLPRHTHSSFLFLYSSPFLLPEGPPPPAQFSRLVSRICRRAQRAGGGAGGRWGARSWLTEELLRGDLAPEAEPLLAVSQRRPTEPATWRLWDRRE